MNDIDINRNKTIFIHRLHDYITRKSIKIHKYQQKIFQRSDLRHLLNVVAKFQDTKLVYKVHIFLICPKKGLLQFEQIICHSTE